MSSQIQLGNTLERPHIVNRTFRFYQLLIDACGNIAASHKDDFIATRALI